LPLRRETEQGGADLRLARALVLLTIFFTGYPPWLFRPAEADR
jgi:cbb3-type cytochrome oxidase subunit 3